MSAVNTALYSALTKRRVTVGGEFGGERNHTGEDLVARPGTPVYAAGRGVVLEIGNTGKLVGLGLYVKVLYQVGKLAVVVTLGHLSKVFVTEQSVVELSTQLGTSGGERGTFGAGSSTAPHLHEQVSVGGRVVEPTEYLNPRSSITDHDQGDTMTPEQFWATIIVNITNSGSSTAADYIRAIRAEVAQILKGQAALVAAVQALAESKGLDPDAISSLIAAKVDAALQDDFDAIPTTLTITGTAAPTESNHA